MPCSASFLGYTPKRVMAETKSSCTTEKSQAKLSVSESESFPWWQMESHLCGLSWLKWLYSFSASSSTPSHWLSDILSPFLPHGACALSVLLKIKSGTINPNVPNNKLHASLKATFSTALHPQHNCMPHCPLQLLFTPTHSFLPVSSHSYASHFYPSHHKVCSGHHHFSEQL